MTDTVIYIESENEKYEEYPCKEIGVPTQENENENENIFTDIFLFIREVCFSEWIWSIFFE